MKILDNEKMKNLKTKEHILTIALIIKDVIILFLQCLIATVLVCVCIENGWILSNDTTEVSNAMFWKLYSAIFIFVPLIMFYRGITGKYHVEIIEQKSKPAMGIAKIKE